MATTKVSVFKLETADAQKSVGDLRKELKELRNTLLNTEKGTDDYTEALRRAGDIQRELNEQSKEVNASAMDFGQVAGNVTKAVGGMVAGFQAAKAVMNLFGVENEEVIKSLQKMQSLMALTQSFSGISSGIDAFKKLSTAIQVATGATSAWGKALISTGIGAIVVALGYLIANFEDISKWLDEITGETDFLGKLSDKVVGGLSASWVALKEGIMGVGKAIVTYVTTPFKSIISAISAISDTEGSMFDKLKAGGEALKDTFVDEWTEVGDTFKQIGEDAANAYNDTVENKQKERLKKQADAEKEAAEKAFEEWAKNENKRLDIELERNKRNNQGKEAVERELEIENQRLKTLKAGSLEYEKQLTKISNLKQQIQDIADKEAEAADKQKERDDEEAKKRQEDINKRRESLFKQYGGEKSLEQQEIEDIQALSKALEDGVINYEEYEKLKAKAHDKYSKIRQEQAEEEARFELETYLNLANGFSSLLTTLADSMDENNKEQFEAAKAFNISAAIINTITGAIGAYTGAASNAGINAIPLVGPALAQAMGITNAATVVAGGIAQIVQLSQTKFGQKTLNAQSISATPSRSAVSSIQAPIQYTQDVQGANIESSISRLGSQKVYVTETDITNTQNKVKVTEDEARF